MIPTAPMYTPLRVSIGFSYFQSLRNNLNYKEVASEQLLKDYFTIFVQQKQGFITKIISTNLVKNARQLLKGTQTMYWIGA